LAKEEEEERWVGSVSRFLKSCSLRLSKSYLNASQGLAFIDSSCLVMKTIGRVITLRKSCQVLHLLTFYSKLVTGNRLHNAFYEKMWLFTLEFEFQHSDTLITNILKLITPFKIIWNLANSVKSFWNQTLSLVIDYRKLVIDYQRVNTLVT